MMEPKFATKFSGFNNLREIRLKPVDNYIKKKKSVDSKMLLKEEHTFKNNTLKRKINWPSSDAQKQNKKVLIPVNKNKSSKWSSYENKNKSYSLKRTHSKKNHLDYYYSNLLSKDKREKSNEMEVVIPFNDHVKKCKEISKSQKKKSRKRRVQLSVKYMRKIDRMETQFKNKLESERKKNKKKLNREKSSFARKVTDLNAKKIDFKNKKKTILKETHNIIEQRKKEIGHLEGIVKILSDDKLKLKGDINRLMKAKYIPGNFYKENKELVNDYDTGFIDKKIRNHIYCVSHRSEKQIKKLDDFFNATGKNETNEKTHKNMGLNKKYCNEYKTLLNQSNLKLVHSNSSMDEVSVPGKIIFNKKTKNQVNSKNLDIEMNKIEVADLKNKLIIPDVLNLPFIGSLKSNVVYENVFEKSQNQCQVKQRKQVIQKIEKERSKYLEFLEAKKPILSFETCFEEDSLADDNFSIEEVTFEQIHQNWNALFFDFPSRVSFIKRLSEENHKSFLIKEYNNFLKSKYKRSKNIYDLIRKRTLAKFRLRETIDKKLGFYLASRSCSVTNFFLCSNKSLRMKSLHFRISIVVQ